MKSKFILKTVVVLCLSSTIMLAFQNCSKTPAFKSLDNVESSSSELESNSFFAVDFHNNNSSSSLNVGLSANTAAQTDCTSDEATFSGEVSNAEKDIKVCLQFALDMPSHSTRYQEKYLCDAANKFSAMPANWKYDQANRKWTSPVEKLKNHAAFVPGSYTLFIMDKNGTIYQSKAAVLKKTGAVNCHATSASSAGASGSSNQCAWTNVAFGGSVSRPPTTACTIANAWTTTLDGNGVSQTCVCPGVANPNERTYAYGYTTAPSYSRGAITYYEMITGNGSRSPQSINSRECIVGQTYTGYNSCDSDWQAAGTGNAYKMCTVWTQGCSSKPN